MQRPGERLCRSAERSAGKLTAHFWLEPVLKRLSFALTHLHPLSLSLPLARLQITWIATPHLPTYCGQDLQKADLIMSQGQVHMPAEGGAHTICLLSLCCEPDCTISTSCPLPSAQQTSGLCWPGILPALQPGSPASDNLLLVLQRWAEKDSRILNSLHWIPE